MIIPRINGVVARRPSPLDSAYDGDKIIVVFPIDLVASGTRSVVEELQEARRLRHERRRPIDWLTIGAVVVALISFWAMILLAVFR